MVTFLVTMSATASDIPLCRDTLFEKRRCRQSSLFQLHLIWISRHLFAILTLVISFACVSTSWQQSRLLWVRVGCNENERYDQTSTLIEPRPSSQKYWYEKFQDIPVIVGLKCKDNFIYLFIFIYSLFNNAIHNSGYIASNVKIIGE